MDYSDKVRRTTVEFEVIEMRRNLGDSYARLECLIRSPLVFRASMGG